MAGEKLLLVSDPTKKKRRTKKGKSLGVISLKSTKSSRGFSSSAPKTYLNNIGLGRTRRATLTFRRADILTAGAGTPIYFDIAVNGMYDPYVPAGGDQPFGFDQLIALYKSYRVESAKISVRFTNSGTNTAPHICQFLLDNDSSISNTLNTRLERTKGVGSKLLLINSNNVQVVTVKFDAKKFFAVKDLSADHQLHGTVSTNPTKIAYGHVIIQCADNTSATTSGVLCEVFLHQNVVFFDPIEQNGS